MVSEVGTLDGKPGSTAADGSPVAVYLALPAEPEFTPVLSHLPTGVNVLDLGCGVGRLANELAERGHEVTGVDESAVMLGHLAPAVTGVHARIEELNLRRRFGAVVLASHFVNHPDPVTRRALLRAAAGHVAADGAVYVEHYDASHVAADRDGHVGPVRVSLRILERDGTWFRARASYLLDGRSWLQEFEAELLDDDMLDQELQLAGLQRDDRLSTSWIVASPTSDR
jgi:SAM-dependent methyltransferase